VFVADVSFITPLGYEGRPTPNPNVLIELGYAANRHGWNRILCVFNSATGRVEDLPFDIRQHSITGYSLTDGQDKAEVRKILVGQLRNKIALILTTPDAAAVQAKTEFNSALFSLLSEVLIYGDEFAPGINSRPVANIQAHFERAAGGLRQLAMGQVAHNLSMTGELKQMADALDTVAQTLRHMGMGDSFATQVAEVLEMASTMKARYLDNIPLNEESLKEVRSLLTQTQRELADLLARADSLVRGRQHELKSKSSELGGRLLRIGLYNIDRIAHHGLGERLRRIGRPLHLAEFVVVCLGGEGLEHILGPIRDADAQLTEIVNSFPKTK
jgi:hypothetical protein